jgi:hypothetical protein
MRRSFHAAKGLLVTEQNIPNSILVSLNGESVMLTEAEFDELCSLKYTVRYAEAPCNETT